MIEIPTRTAIIKSYNVIVRGSRPAPPGEAVTVTAVCHHLADLGYWGMSDEELPKGMEPFTDEFYELANNKCDYDFVAGVLDDAGLEYVKHSVASSKPRKAKPSSSDLELINRYRARIGMRPLDPKASGWGPEDIQAEARRIRALNPKKLRAIKRRLMNG